MNAIDTRAHAQSLDQADPLKDFRSAFVIADSDLIYLDGNSLGRLPKRAAEQLQNGIEATWGKRLIRGWNEAWMYLPEQLGARIAKLIGAQPDEVILADSTSVNLFKLASAALAARPNRQEILTDDLNFPSDLYVLDSAAQASSGRRLRILESIDQVYGPELQLQQALGDQTALLSLTHTVFKSAFVYDMAGMTRSAHEAGALTLWDLSHSVGSVDLDLNGSGADLAVGCTYKYLNGGPGAPAFLYVRRDLQDELLNPISGWMGRDDMFGFQRDFEPHAGIRRFLTGTPSVLGLLGIEAGVELILEAGMDALRAKSVAQTEYLIALFESMLEPLGFHLKSPRENDRRGSHVTLSHDLAWQIAQVLTQKMNVIPDFRAPDNIRLGIAPIYTRFEDIYEGVRRMQSVVENGLHLDVPAGAGGVT